METTGLSFTRYFVFMLLLHMITPSSEQFTVTGLQGPIVAPLGGVVELSCHLSPPQSAEHMEVRWFRNRYTQPVHLYKNGKDLHGETISQYVERTQLLKEAIGKGKVTLRISNVSVDDDGPYHCFFKDGDFYEEAITEVKVTATSFEIQILVHPPNATGLLVECNSRGWFPQPQMEWRNSRGEIIPPASISHSQGTNKLFDMKMTLLIRPCSQKNVTCYLQNPVTGQEETTSIVLSDKLFPWNIIWILILTIGLALPLTFNMLPSVTVHYRIQKRQRRKAKSSSAYFRAGIEDGPPTTGCRGYFWCIMTHPIVAGVVIFLNSVCVTVLLTIYLQLKSRVPPSDPFFQLDTIWLENIIAILYIVVVFITMFISSLYFRVRGFLEFKEINNDA